MVPRKASIQHSLSTMEQSFLSNKAAVIVAASPNQNAGGSMTDERIETDRLTLCANGSKLGAITYTLQLDPATTTLGTIEFCCFRMERQFSAPVIGVDPLPTEAEITSSGLQQMMRQNLPSWVMKFGVFPITEAISVAKSITVSPGKLGMPAMRDGDYTGIILFNRTNGSIGYGVQMRYRSYR